MRQRLELLADQADQEVIVVGVEAVTGEPDVMGEVGVTVGATDRAVLAQDGALLLGATAWRTLPSGAAGTTRPRATPG